jgi:hypothetical protein
MAYRILLSRVSLFLVATWSGCSNPATAGADAQAGTVSRRDSADISIILSPANTPLKIYRADPVPELSIGGPDGQAVYVFNNVRWATELPDGSIAVLDGNAELRVFDQHGTHTRTYGGLGEGPGEFRVPRRIWPRADSILVWDKNNRITVVPLDGGTARAIVSQAPLPLPTDNRAWYDGTSVLVPISTRPPIVEGMEGRHRGDLQVQIRFFAVPLDGTIPRTVATLPGAVERYIELRVGSMGMANFYPLAMYGTALAAASPGLFYAGTARRPAVQAFDTAGTLVHEIRWDTSTIPVDGTVAERFLAAQPPAMRAIPVADSVAYYDDLRADRDGNLWVRLFDIPAPDRPQRWMIFSRDGERIGVAEIPADLEVYEVSLRSVLGMTRDSLRVEMIRRFPLLEPSQ